MAGPTAAQLKARVAELEEQVPDFEAKIAQLEAQLAEQPQTTDKPTNVIEAILAVMREVRAVGKNERNTTPGQSYNFRGIDTTVNALGPAMRKHGLVALPNLLKVERRGVQTSRGNAQQASEVEVEYRFYGPGGIADTVSAVVPGESWDSGDKGVAKAMSVAFRVALLQSFALPTDMPDPDLDTYERAHNVDVTEFLAEVAGAVSGPNPNDALRAVWEKYTPDVLVHVMVPSPDGARQINGTELISTWVQTINAPQPAAAPPGGDEAPVQPVQADESVHAEQVAEPVQRTEPVHAEPVQPAREEPTPARAPAAAPARAEKPIYGMLRDEMRGQAETLGVPVTEHIAPLLAERGKEKVGDIEAGTVMQWVAAQRPAVIEALLAQARASEAEAYSKVPAIVPGMWAILTGTHEVREDARAPQDANQ